MAPSAADVKAVKLVSTLLSYQKLLEEAGDAKNAQQEAFMLKYQHGSDPGTPPEHATLGQINFLVAGVGAFGGFHLAGKVDHVITCGRSLIVGDQGVSRAFLLSPTLAGATSNPPPFGHRAEHPRLCEKREQGLLDTELP